MRGLEGGGPVKRFLSAALMFGGALAALGQLAKYKDWVKSPEAVFLTPSEKADFAKLASDADAEKFIADYWARRGGDAFHQEVDRRIAAADQQFKMRGQKGSESARGKIFIALGSPTRVTEARTPGSADSTSPDSGAGTGLSQLQQEAGPGPVVQTWIYDKSKFDPSWDIGDIRAQINVDPQRGRDELMNAGAVSKAIDKVNEKRMADAGKKAAAAPSSAAASSAPAPSGNAAPPAPAPAAPAAPAAAAGGAPPPPAPAAALPAAARSALDAVAKAATARTTPGFWGGDFQTVTGDPFYAFQIILPASKVPAGGAAPKLGGVVTREDGTEATTIWEDAVLADSKNGNAVDKSADKSIVLPAGRYKGSFGLFSPDGATALTSAGTSFEIPSKSSDFKVSPLVLASTLTPLTKRPNPTDPFVFGMEKPIRVEPKGNGMFSREDGLWYFYTVSNPALPAETPAAPAGEAPAAAATPAAGAAPAATPAVGAAPAAPAPRPRIMTRIGVLRDGKPAFQPATLPAELQPLGTSYYASGSEIPLATFEPGYYTFTINIRDLNSPRDSAAFKGVDRSGDFVVLAADGNLPPTPTPAAPKTTPTPRPKKK
jgi:GWxTD domain-containing protein